MDQFIYGSLIHNICSVSGSVLIFIPLFQIRDWVCVLRPLLTGAARWKWQASIPRCSAAVIQAAAGPWVTSQRFVQYGVPVSLRYTCTVMHTKLTVGHTLRKKKNRIQTHIQILNLWQIQTSVGNVNALDGHFVRLTKPEILKPSSDITYFLNTSLPQPSASHLFGSELMRVYVWATGMYRLSVCQNLR